MKKISFLILLLVLIFSLVACNKNSVHDLKDIKSIDIFDINDDLVYQVSESDLVSFVEDLNSLVYNNHSATISLKIKKYIIINYEKYSVKINVLTTGRIKDGNYYRNRNRLYDETEFYNLIDKYNRWFLVNETKN